MLQCSTSKTTHTRSRVHTQTHRQVHTLTDMQLNAQLIAQTLLLCSGEQVSSPAQTYAYNCVVLCTVHVDVE